MHLYDCETAWLLCEVSIYTNEYLAAHLAQVHKRQCLLYSTKAEPTCRQEKNQYSKTLAKEFFTLFSLLTLIMAQRKDTCEAKLVVVGREKQENFPWELFIWSG